MVKCSKYFILFQNKIDNRLGHLIELIANGQSNQQTISWSQFRYEFKNSLTCCISNLVEFHDIQEYITNSVLAPG